MDDVVLVQVVDVVRLEPPCPEVRVNLLEAGAQPRRDQRQAGDFPKRGRVGPGRERRIVRNEQDPRVAHQLHHLERPFLQRRHREGEVEVAALDGAQQHGVGGRLLELNLDTGPSGAEALEQRRQDARAGALEGADPKPPGSAVDDRGDVGLRGLESRNDRFRVAQHEPTGFRQRHGARASWSLKELCPDQPLEGRDLLRDR